MERDDVLSRPSLAPPALFMSTSATIAIRCYAKPSVNGLAPRTLTVLLGTGTLHFGACTRRNSGTGTAADVGASPLGSARGLATRLSDFATNRHE